MNYNENFLTFEFSALDYTSPLILKYAYKLEGLESKWNYCDAKSRIAKYTDLSQGKYVFRVKGCNSDGVWNETGTSLTIIISPPWWKTTLAYIFYVLLFFSFIYWYIKHRERNLRREKEKLEEKVEERTHQLKEANEELNMQKEEISAIL